ncbi:MAG: hypothetical protein DRJ38_08460 [Thermoprotei archaeon]|nr:MAG: hypothetical protein DRJ38_08460 [Thermoprotei archaeon]
MSEVLNFSNVFFPVYIKELLESPSEFDEHRLFLKIGIGDLVLKIRKIRIIAEILDKKEGSKWIDYKIYDGTGEITMRIWHDTSYISSSKLELKDLYVIFGFFKEFRKFRYISPVIVRKCSNANFEEWYHRIELVRSVIIRNLSRV